MSSTGVFKADFTSFYEAVTKANLSMDSLEKGAAKAEGRLQRMVDSFSGGKIIQQAELAVEAVKRVGGVTALTEKEQAALNAQLTEAIAKYTAIGKVAPQAMVDLEKATQAAANKTKTVDDTVGKMIGTLGSLAGAVGIGFSVGAVVSFAGKVFDTAAHIKDLSDKLAISTDAVQGFAYAAAQGGADIDTVGGAMEKMNEKLSEPGKGTVAALDKLHLSFATLSTMKPEDQFLAITDAIQKLPNPADQSRIAVEMFGKKGAELLPAIRDGFRDVANAANKMSTQTIKDLEKAQQAWENLSNQVVITTGNIIAKAPEAAKIMTASWGDFLRFTASAALPSLAGPLLSGISTKLPEIQAPDVSLPSPHAPAGPKAKTADQIAEEEAAAKKYADALKEIAAAQIPLTAAQEASSAAMLKQGISASTIATALHVSSVAVQNYADQLKNSEAIAKAWSDLQKDMAKSAHELTMSGIDKIQGDAQKEADVRVNAQDAMFKQLTALREKNLQASMTDHDRRVEQIEHEKEQSLAAYRTMFGEGSVLFQQFAAAVGEDSSNAFQQLAQSEAEAAANMKDDPPKVSQAWTQALDQIAGAMSQLASVSGTTIGAVIQNLSGIVSAASNAKSSIEGIKSAKKEGFSLSGIADMASGIMGIASAAIQAGVAIKNMFFGSKGRDAVKDFAASFQEFDLGTMQFKPGGGFDELHAKLGALGKQGEQLWIALTQGVGKNNPEQANAVIKLINDALSKQAGLQTAAGDAATATGDKQSAAAKKAQAALDDMNNKIKGLQDSIAGEAPEEFMGAVEAQTRKEIAALEVQRDAAKAAIGETTDAIADQEAAQDSSAASSEAQTQVLVDNATEVATALKDEVGASLSENETAWITWGDTASAQIARIVSELRTLTTPLVPGSVSGPITGGNGDTYQTDLYLDGDRIARTVAKKMPSVLRGVGVS